MGIKAGEPYRPAIEVIPAAPADEQVLANLLELYSHDFSELMDLELQPDGRFGYPWLPLYWEEPDRYAFLVKVNDRLAGLVLVTRGSHVGSGPGTWDVAEFFVVRRHRGRGIGKAVALEIWSRFPGPWEVRVLESNAPAGRFWRAAAQAFAGRSVVETIMPVEGRSWRLFSFSSPGITSSQTAG